MEMTYDQALARLQDIIARLEKDEAISIADYKTLAAEAGQLLTYCHAQLAELEHELKPETEQQ